MKLQASTRRKANKELQAMSAKYHEQVPLDGMFETLKAHGIIVVDEAGDPWQGMLLGSNSHTTFALQIDGQPVDNAVLFLSWYRMPSQRWEINTYLS